MRNGTGSHATSPPLMTAPDAIASPSTVPARLSPSSTLTPGSSAWAASTYQASSGPESRARKTPWSSSATRKAVSDWAKTKTSPEARATTVEASSTGRRPMESARPPVGSSRPRTTKPCIAKTSPISATERPRSSGISVETPMPRPIGNHRVKVRTSRTRRARSAVTGVLTGHHRLAVRGRGRAGSRRGTRRPDGRWGCPARRDGTSRRPPTPPRSSPGPARRWR